jgi:hypothetical protein
VVPGGAAFAVYYVGGTGAGPRLFREWHGDAEPGVDRGTAAVRSLLARTGGSDPDYRSEWPDGWTVQGPVRHSGGVITVALRGPVSTAVAPTGRLAALGVQQLVYTVQDALGSHDPVRIEVPGGRLWDVPLDRPVARAEDSATRALVQIDQPGEDAVFTGPAVRVSGEASTSEASLLWQVFSGATVVAHGHASTGEALTFSPFAFTVALRPGRYTLRVFESDDSGGEGRPPFTDSRTLTVRR